MADRLVKPYIDFRGGWNADAAPDNLVDNELELADNVDLSERGGISKRKGCVPLNSVSYGAQVERLIEWPRNDGSSVLLAVVGTTLAKINDDGSKVDVITLDSPELGYFIFQDKFWFTGRQGGVNRYWYYDGAQVNEVTPNPASDNDLAPIKRCRHFLWHPNSYRVFAAGDYQDRIALYYSEPNDPTYFKASSKEYPITGDGPITGLSSFSDAMLAFYQRRIYGWTGVDPATDATWKRLPVGQGTIAPRTISLTPTSITFLGMGGIYLLSPGLLDYNVVLIASEQLVQNLAENKVTSVIRSIVNPERACAVYDPYEEKYMLAYSDDPSEQRNSKILVLDWSLKSFTRWTGIQVNDFCLRSNGDLLAASNGYILKLKQGFSDWDCETGSYKPISFHVKTKQYGLDYPFHVKKTKKLFLAARQYEAETSALDLEVTADYVTLRYENVVLDESFAWGEPWGNIWGWIDYVTKEARCRLKGQRFQVSIANKNPNEPVTIYGLAFEFRALKPKGVKVNGQA